MLVMLAVITKVRYFSVRKFPVVLWMPIPFYHTTGRSIQVQVQIQVRVHVHMHPGAYGLYISISAHCTLHSRIVTKIPINLTLINPYSITNAT